MHPRIQKRRVVFSSDLETDNEDSFTLLPPSDPLSESSDDDAAVVQTSDDIPLMGLLDNTKHHNADRQSSPTQFLPGREDSPNTASPSAQGGHFRPRSSSLPIPMTPSRGVQHALGFEHSPLLAPDFGPITPRTQRRFNYKAGQRKRRETLARKKIEAEERHKNEKMLLKENERMRKALFLDETAEILQGKLAERGYSLADFLDHIFDPDRKFVFDWRWKGFFAHQTTVRRIFEYWTTSKYSKTARTIVLDFAASLVERTVGQESRQVTRSALLQKRKKIVNEDFFLKYSLSDLTNDLRGLAPRMFQILDAFSTTKRQMRDMSAAWFKKKNLVFF
jgi:hypothetical protein